MSPEREPRETDDAEREPFDDGHRRTIFSTTWFRAAVVLVVLGVIAAVAVPYVLEMMNPPVPAPGPPVAAKAPAAPPPAPAVVATSPLPAEKKERATPVLTPAAPSAPPTKAGATVTPPKASEPPKGETRKRAAPKKDAEARRPAKAATATATGGDAGAYWVQVGAFKDQATAKRVAAQLRGAQFRVEESATRIGESAPAPAAAATAQPAPDRYDVLVSGGSLAEINARLASKGLAAEPSGSGVAIRPSLPLRDAVALSKDLAADGLKVQVKRATADGAPAPARAVAPAGGAGVTLYRVRVGAFPDRASAQSAARDLEARGYKVFIARGRD
jgi:cell division protein FtsN